MFFNTSLSLNLEDVCFKCKRFIVKENKNYFNPLYQNKVVKEIVTFDCGLCDRLEDNFDFINIENFEEINLLNKDEQLVFVSFSMDVPEIVDKHFVFAGFDIVNNYNSFLTNYSNEFLKEQIGVEDLTELGLIKFFEIAKNTKFVIDKKFSINSNIAKIYRII